MRILQVTHSYYPAVRYGGPIRSVANLCKGLQDLGHHVEVCTTDSDSFGHVEVPLNRTVPVNGVPVNYFHCPGWHYSGFSPGMEKWLYNNAATFDLVHIQGVWTFPQRYAARIARRNRIPYIISPRGMADGRIAHKRFRLAKWAYINVYDRPNLQEATLFHYTAPGEESNSLFKDLPPSTCVIPNPILEIGHSTPEYHANQIDTKTPESRYILVVGRIAWTKNIDTLIRVLGQLGPQNEDIQLLVVGPDTENLRPSLEALAKREGVHSRVRFAGVVQGAALKKLYHEALLLASPALSESFGNTIAEALLEETPVVATSGSGISSFPELSPCFSLCTQDVQSIRHAILAVINDFAYWKTKAAQARHFIEQNFSVQQVATKMADAYQDILQKSRSTIAPPGIR
jgi:glycosyltransferase involved in cell wall biosynthesis